MKSLKRARSQMLPTPSASAQALIGAYRTLPCAGEALPAALDSWDEAKWAGLDMASQDDMNVLSLAW